MKVHPAAELFPLMGEAELAELAEDIKRNGLQMSILRTKDGSIVDGRNRELACEMAGVKPSYEDLESDNGDMVALVVSLNVKRRNLNASQRAMAAAGAWEMEDAEREAAKAKGETSAKVALVGKSEQRFGKLFGVSPMYVRQARAVLKDEPLSAESVKNGVIRLDDAHKAVQKTRQRESDRQRAVRMLQASAPDLAERVESNELALEEAVTLMRQREREILEARTRLLGYMQESVSHLSGDGKHAAWVADQVRGEQSADEWHGVAAFAAAVASHLETEGEDDGK